MAPIERSSDPMTWPAERERRKHAEAEVKRLREALKFYADEESWHLPDDPMSSMTSVEEDHGERAREALLDG